MDKIRAKLTKKTATIGVAALLTIGGGSAFALTANDSTAATEEPPIVTQVNDHENRITDLETRADDTEAKVDKNTSDIQTLQGNTTTTETPAAPTQSIESTTPSTTPSTTTEPAPEPVDPYTIVKVEITPRDGGGKKCYYTLENGMTKTIYNGASAPCYEEGTILPYNYRPR